MDTTYCGGFCEFKTDVDNICTLHVNCCVSLGNKIADLRNILNDLKRCQSLSNEEKMKGQFHLQSSSVQGLKVNHLAHRERFIRIMSDQI
jgi:hypothetical protein